MSDDARKLIIDGEHDVVSRASQDHTKAKGDCRMKNECAKLRPKSQPYEVWQSGAWTWNVLKKWQADDAKPYARWFCNVVTPMCPDGEMGDVYVSTIKSQARRIA